MVLGMGWLEWSIIGGLVALLVFVVVRIRRAPSTDATNGERSDHDRRGFWILAALLVAGVLGYGRFRSLASWNADKKREPVIDWNKPPMDERLRGLAEFPELPHVPEVVANEDERTEEGKDAGRQVDNNPNPRQTPAVRPEGTEAPERDAQGPQDGKDVTPPK